MLKKIRYISRHGEVYEFNQYVGSQFDEETGYLFWNRKNSARTFAEVDFPEEMTDLEIGRMTKLAKRIWRNSNMLGYRGNGGVKPYTMQQFATMLGLGVRQTERFISKMQVLGVLAKVTIESEGQIEASFFVNPVYFFAGNRINLNLYLIFKESLDQVLPDWVKSRFNEAQKVGEEG